MTYKEIEKEFDKKFIEPGFSTDNWVKVQAFIKAKINQIIDEMIGEVEKMEKGITGLDNWTAELGDVATQIVKGLIKLKKYKKKFNI